MTKKEAILAMLEGKKVRSSIWRVDEFLYFDDECSAFMDEDGEEHDINGLTEGAWGEYKELVTFHKALEHMCVPGNTAKATICDGEEQFKLNELGELLVWLKWAEKWDVRDYDFSTLNKSKWELM